MLFRSGLGFCVLGVGFMRLMFSFGWFGILGTGGWVYEVEVQFWVVWDLGFGFGLVHLRVLPMS